MIDYGFDCIDLTPEQYERWKRGELLIQFQMDEPPTVNPQDFERWVRERTLKPMLYQHDNPWTPQNAQTIFSEEVKPLVKEL